MNINPIQTKIIKIGNSKGIRIPKLMLEQSRLGENVELIMQENSIVIRSAPEPRSGWENHFRKMAAAGDEALLEVEFINNDFDDKEWEW